MFVHSFYFVSYYFFELHLELHVMIFLKIFKRPIIAGWGRDMGTILRPIQISIQICGWRYFIGSTRRIYYRWKCRRIYSVGNVPAGNCFFFARVSVCKIVGGLFFLFATELATERGITDNYYTDRRVPSGRPLVIISPTEFIPVTNGMSLSVKLFNGVVDGHWTTKKSVKFSYI
jgi:hypothetical protein